MIYATLIQAIEIADALNDIDGTVHGMWDAVESTNRPGRYTVRWLEA